MLPVFRPAPAQGLIIPSGAYLIANNGNIVVAANWTNNGSFTHNGGTVIFAGSVQTLGGSSTTTFNNLTVASGSVTSIITSGQNVKGIVLSNDTLKANGNLTLLSTATQTALIDGSGSGEVMGNLAMQRYLPSGFGYKYFSSPFQADIVNDFSQEINLATAFPDVYRFDESLASNGWVNYTNSSGLLSPIAGYAVNFGNATPAITVSLTGVVSNHTVSSPTMYNHNMTYTQGFNLMGNPYPSPINWDAAGGWTKTNIDNAIYYFKNGTTDQYTGTYSSYVNGISSDGIAGNLISAMQGFFVHVSSGSFPVSGLLSINNNARNTNPSTVFFGYTVPQAPSPLFRLSAGFADEGTEVDLAAFYFKTGATAAFDKKLDALKLMNTHTGIPNLYAVSSDTGKLSIYALPATFDSLVSVPLGLKTAKDGWISFKAGEMENMPPSLYVYLSDIKTGAMQDLQNAPPYRLFLASGDYSNRFFLNFSTKPLITAAPGSTPVNGGFKAYSAGGKLFVNSGLLSAEKGELRIINMLGQVTHRQELSGNAYQTVNAYFIPGIYIVSFYAAAGIQIKKIFIGAQ